MIFKTQQEFRQFLFRDWHGCLNHDCIVNGPQKGMGTNGGCKCLPNASRTQLNLLKTRLSVLVTQVEEYNNQYESMASEIDKLNNDIRVMVEKAASNYLLAYREQGMRILSLEQSRELLTQAPVETVRGWFEEDNLKPGYLYWSDEMDQYEPTSETYSGEADEYHKLWLSYFTAIERSRHVLKT